MPSVSKKKAYARGEMLRALANAGQFAHIGESKFESALDDCYSRSTRLKIEANARQNEGWYIDNTRRAIQQAVPDCVLSLYECGHLTGQVFFAAGVFRYVAARLGVVCCLCGAIDSGKSGYSASLPTPFIRFLSPRSCFMTGGDVEHPNGLCVKCERQLANRLWRVTGVGMYRKEATKEDCAVLLAWLSSNPPFKKRVQENADNWQKLRFDPRKVPA